MKNVSDAIINYLKYLHSAGVEVIPRVRVEEQQTVEGKGAISRSGEEVEEPTLRKVSAQSLEELRSLVENCTLCELHRERKNPVFGEGNTSAKLIFVGEAPGEEEDKMGRPFVGRAGELLTKMIEAMGLRREDVYICNVLKCRPPGNRDPMPHETSACLPFLWKQLELIKPQVVITLGNHALKALTGEKKGVTLLHGRWYNVKGMRVIPTFHPAFLLRNPSMKKFAWQDLKKVMKALGLM